MWRAAWVVLACLLAPSLAAAAGPGAYSARRFDVNARIVSGGSLEVTETITFDFESGTFTKVWREIPAARTDGIDVVEASMDGTPVSRGEGAGHFVVSGRNRLRVEWQFAPTGPSSHTFALRYIARGVAYRDGENDVVRWRLLPAEHRYKIGASHSTIAALVNPADTATVRTSHVDAVSINQAGNRVDVVATGIRANGWVIAEAHYPAGTLVTAVPEWRQRELSASTLAPRWAAAASAIFIVAILFLVLNRQGYDAPGFDAGPATTTAPPDTLPVALAAALAAKGSAFGYQAAATLVDLADRGVLTIRELPRRMGVRYYALNQVPGQHELDDHEAEAVTIAFAGSGDEVPMSRARARLARGARRFGNALNGDLARRGLLDPSRKAVRDRLTVVSIGMLFAAGLGAIGVSALIPRYEGWPFLMPLALALGGIVGVAMTAATTPLSDEGLVEGARWRGFKRHLRALADARGDAGSGPIRSRWIVYGIGLGLAQPWSRYLKKHPAAAPPWFVAAATDDAGAFAAFVGSHVAGTAGAGAGTAAGGGSSGAG